ncbi:MAG: TRAP transporter large permease [Caenispirillum bisanense]|nr:TRAP transporter large permease [Caenispirillum bisanense]MCA1973141.1 TRAP transporter large permease [Caenispirillum sp.]
MTAVMLGTMIGLLLLGFPMMIPLIAATIIAFVAFFPGMPTTNIIQQMIGGVSPSALIAVPMFILAADIVTKGHTADRLLDLVMRFIGHIKGGLAVTTAVTCTLFGAVSGSTQATVVAIGGPLRPKMVEAGYRDSFVMALAINASDIAFLIPPSIGMIIYGVISGTSIAELFIAGIGPGVMILIMFSAYSVYFAIRENIPTQPKATWGERLQAIKGALWPLGFPVIIIGGIYGGIFSPTEAAAVSVAYALILELLIFRSVKVSELPEIALSTGLITAVVFILVGAGAAFSWIISFAMIPQAIIGSLGLEQAGPTMVLVAISIAFFVGCMFVDPIVVILVLTPIFAPLVQGAGLDPVLVGTIITLQVAIGSATPPFGCDIFTAIAIFRRPYFDVIRGTPPFIIMLLLSSVLLIAFPQIALFLRDLAFR